MGLYTRHSGLEPEYILLFLKSFGKWVPGQARDDSAFYLGGALSLK
jgi:hypothetical protein